MLFQILDDRIDVQIDSALEVHRVHAGGNRFSTPLTIAWASTVAVAVPSRLGPSY
jgi:hypothetical protein